MSRYEIVCDCGTKQSGERTDVSQAFKCRGCGLPLYVLPRDAWSNSDDNSQSASEPEPASTAQHADYSIAVPADEEIFAADTSADEPTFDAGSTFDEVREPGTMHGDSVDEDDGTETFKLAEPEPTRTPPPDPTLPDDLFDLGEISESLPPLPGESKKTPAKVNFGATGKSGSKGKADPELFDDDGPTATPQPLPKSPTKKKPAGADEPLTETGRERESTRKMLPLVLLATLLIVGLIGYWAWKGGSRSEAEVTFSEELARAEEALEARDFITAEKALTEAVAAADKLERTTARADRARHLLQEVRAGNELLGDAPFAILDEAGQTVALRGADGWRDDFDARFQGRWMIVEAPVRKMSGDEWSLDLPIRAGERIAVWRFKSDDLDQFLSDDETRPVVLAAKWISCEPEPGAWEIRLSDVFLWRHWETLERTRLLTEGEWTDARNRTTLPDPRKTTDASS